MEVKQKSLKQKIVLQSAYTSLIEQSKSRKALFTQLEIS